MVVIKIKQHQVSPHSGYFFDTNVWLYIFGPVAGTDSRKQNIYSQLLRDILNHKASIYISSLVVSEYINAALRIGFNQWKRVTCNVNASFKRDYRGTKEYNEAVADIKSQTEEILSICEKRPDDFHRVDISRILSLMSQDADYNDAYYLHDCEISGLKLVSDDTDMQDIQIPVTLITA